MLGYVRAAARTAARTLLRSGLRLLASALCLAPFSLLGRRCDVAHRPLALPQSPRRPRSLHRSCLTAPASVLCPCFYDDHHHPPTRRRAIRYHHGCHRPSRPRRQIVLAPLDPTGSALRYRHRAGSTSSAYGHTIRRRPHCRPHCHPPPLLPPQALSTYHRRDELVPLHPQCRRGHLRRHLRHDHLRHGHRRHGLLRIAKLPRSKAQLFSETRN